MSALSLQDVRIGYRSARGEVTVAEGLEGAVEEGTLVCLLGVNGSGKSTLIRTVAGLLPPLGGQIKVVGKSPQAIGPRELARRMSLVLSQRVNSGSLTVGEMVALGRYPYTGWAGRLTRLDREIVESVMQELDVDGMRDRSISELSDGEYQRVAVARALAQQPRLLVLDEPTAHLDVAQRLKLASRLRDLARGRGIGVLMSTHEIDLALRIADVLWVIDGGSMDLGPPEVLGASGVIERAFAAEGLRFDQQEGTFIPVASRLLPASLNAEGQSEAWLKRLLIRHGFMPGNASEPVVTVEEVDSGYVCITQSGVFRSGDLAELSQVLASVRRRSGEER